MRLTIRTSLGLLIAATAACRTTSDGAAVKVTNGQETSAYSAVVRLDVEGGTCTGTFVDDRRVLTAAHCVTPYHEGRTDYPRVNDWTPDAVFVADGFFANVVDGHIALGADAYDLAVIDYGAGAAEAAGVQAFPAVATTFPGVGTPVTLVGFGLTDAQDQTSNAEHRKYVGKNAILTAGQGAITITGPCAATDATTLSATAPGDSGGPLLAGDYTLIGVVSNGDCVNGTMQSKFTAVTHAFAKGLLAQAGVATGPQTTNPVGGGGAKLCGKVTANSTFCIDAARTTVTVYSTVTSDQASYSVQSANPSTQLPGAVSYVGTATLSWLQPFAQPTTFAFLVAEAANQGRVLVSGSGGWTAWPGSSSFALFSAP